PVDRGPGLIAPTHGDVGHLLELIPRQGHALTLGYPLRSLPQHSDDLAHAAPLSPGMVRATSAVDRRSPLLARTSSSALLGRVPLCYRLESSHKPQALTA